MQKRYKLICAAFVKSFFSALLHLSEMDSYIPSHNCIKNMNLGAWVSEVGAGGKGSPGFWKFQQKRLFFQFRGVKIKFHHFWPSPGKILEKSPSALPLEKSFRRPWLGAKPFWGARAAGSLWSGLHSEQPIELQKSTAVESDSILSGCPDNGTKSLWSVSAGNKSSFFPTTYRCEAVFQTIILKPGTDINFNQQTTSGVRLRIQALISTNLWNKSRDKILIEICECGVWTEFAKTSVCIILVVLVYLEPAKISTGPKTVHVLKKVEKHWSRIFVFCINNNFERIQGKLTWCSSLILT